MLKLSKRLVAWASIHEQWISLLDHIEGMREASLRGNEQQTMRSFLITQHNKVLSFLRSPIQISNHPNDELKLCTCELVYINIWKQIPVLWNRKSAVVICFPETSPILSGIEFLLHLHYHYALVINLSLLHHSCNLIIIYN